MAKMDCGLTTDCLLADRCGATDKRMRWARCRDSALLREPQDERKGMLSLGGADGLRLGSIDWLFEMRAIVGRALRAGLKTLAATWLQ